MIRIVIGVVLAAACAAYGCVIRGVGDGTRFYTVWFALAVLIVVTMLLPKLTHVARTRVGIVFWRALAVLARVFWAAFALVMAVTCCLVGSQFVAQGSPDLDYIIVLGAQVYDNGPSEVLRYRLDAAYDYLEENPGTVCIVSGGKGANEPRPEGAVMRQYLVGRGIDADRIVEEDESRNTAENIANSKAIILEREGLPADTAATPEDVTVGIVTTNFHVFRGRALARHAGITGAVGIAARINPVYLPNNVLREAGGIAKDLLAGNLL